ncbi:hypothetical protein FB382_002986 [Nocardioides ginsengisegetis]|uniref:DUF4349 domain-containing protein n=1 Tax=Nocardioides ginsengisegetis TaxID=661491 RepID=A0A7W3J1Y2_9ACTN|nr:DUF4349 domain-containing protein [Nocardioides ginsengisegetis]MBA8804695.1 hypothetical protein [Nocardioides ginsengisegetis]
MTTTAPRRPTTRRRVPSTAAALVLGLGLAPALAACSAGGSGGSGDTSAADAPAPAADGSVAGGGMVDSLASARDMASSESYAAARTPAGKAEQPAPDGTEQALISTGTVSLSSKDVAGARFDVQKVVDKYAGEISDEQTDTDDDGHVATSHLVIRIPSADFEKAMADLKGVADLEYASAKSEDVTTQVIDTRSRLKVQRASIARITTLLARAQNLRDIVLIESQLSRRQATLDSLERRAAYLADQTSQSTITVDIEKASVAAAHKKHVDHTGFVPGLKAGWSGLTAIAVAVATAAGAALPFTVVLLLLALLAWPVLRTLRRRHPGDPGGPDLAVPTEG